MFGINKIGRMTSRPAPKSSSDPENRGVYLHVFTQTDVKVGKWMNKMLINLAATSSVEFATNLRKYSLENLDKLKKHVEDQEILYNNV